MSLDVNTQTQMQDESYADPFGLTHVEYSGDGGLAADQLLDQTAHAVPNGHVTNDNTALEFTEHKTESEIDKLMRALQLNRDYQAYLRDQLRVLDQAQQRNRELQRAVSETLMKQACQPVKASHVIAGAVKSKASKSKSGIRYFVDELGNMPPDNEDGARRKAQLAKMPMYHKPKRWTPAELKSLAKGVRQQNQQLLVNKLYEECADKSIEEFNADLEQIKTLSDRELEDNLEGIDWELVAKTCCPDRSGEDCRIKWLATNPLVNKSPWSKDEDKKLLQLATTHEATHWERVAQELNTHRTPTQCLMRYQRSLNVKLLKSKWTEAEDKLLMASVRKYGEKNWQQVANSLENRTGQQALHRWMKTLSPHIKRGKWEWAEDIRLALSVQAYGQNRLWNKLHRHVPRRTDVQCRERWCNVLNPDLNMGPWTPEEDEKLMESVARHGLGKWALVAIDLYPRTDNQCWRRWKTGRKDQLSAYRRTIKKKEQLLVKNFAGREKERPHHIDVEDLVDLSEEGSEDEDEELELSDDSEEYAAKNRKRKAPQRSTRATKRRKTSKDHDSESEGEGEESDEVTGDTSSHVIDTPTRKTKAKTVPAKTKTKPRAAPAKKGRKGSAVPSATPEPASEPVLIVDRDVLIDEQQGEVTDSALPVVLPSPVTLRAAFKLLTTLDQTARPESAADERNLDLVLEHVDSPDFKLLAAWFNSLFLYPALISKDAGFITNPINSSTPSSAVVNSNNWNINNLTNK